MSNIFIRLDKIKLKTFDQTMYLDKTLDWKNNSIELNNCKKLLIETIKINLYNSVFKSRKKKLTTIKHKARIDPQNLSTNVVPNNLFAENRLSTNSLITIPSKPRLAIAPNK